jgi:hypothetical protein
MLDIKQFRELIVAPTLKEMNMWSLAAEDLMVGTAIMESNLVFLQQKNGPALGVYQIEPNTAKDILFRYLPDKPNIDNIMRDLFDYLTTDWNNRLIYDLRFATAIARLKYWMVPRKIPETLEGQAEYWKQYYNTYKGAGKVSDYIHKYKIHNR